jgi:hypothetical protein
MVTITGIAATFLITARVYPLIPVSEGFYKPQITFNGVCLSYGAKTIAGHTAASVAWACATFVNAFLISDSAWFTYLLEYISHKKKKSGK